MTTDIVYDQHEKHFVALDCIIFGFDQQELQLLLIKRGFEPEKGNWSLMGGFLKSDESVDEGAERILETLTGLTGVYMEQLYAYGEVRRDPVARTISIAYYALIRTDQYNKELADSHNAQWFPVSRKPALIFDHNVMVEKALARLRRRARIQPIGFELLPEKFTIPQLRSLYEAINNQPLDHRNFSKRLNSMEWLVKLNEKDKTSSRKGAFYYQFDEDLYQKLVQEGSSFALK
ncbi:NUDIX domain-containing protein [Larkinella bovis]|uniref:NUDIX domain-containing protein n=1 Tax=Larkinella bovis TaxID=683041 RepID=A0ABW0I528_9BACT